MVSTTIKHLQLHLGVRHKKPKVHYYLIARQKTNIEDICVEKRVKGGTDCRPFFIKTQFSWVKDQNNPNTKLTLTKTKEKQFKLQLVKRTIQKKTWPKAIVVRYAARDFLKNH